MLLTIVAVLVGIGIWYNVPINLMDLEHDEVIEIVTYSMEILEMQLTSQMRHKSNILLKI